jgi:glycosyltransferase involved in cell wall biosynthesis
MPTADLSVVMANYNHARYLPRALDAILAQSVQAREIIVLDDASTKDNSLEVLAEYARRDPAIRVIRNEINLGVVPSYNKGLALASGGYVLLAGADDYLMPGFIEKSVAVLDQHPRAGLCYSYDSYSIGDDGPVEVNPSGWCDRPAYFPPDEVCRLLRCVIPGHAVVCRRERLVQAGGYRPELAWYSDWFAFLTVAFRHGVCHVPETLAIRVLLADGYSANARHGEKNVAALGAFLARITAPEYADVAPYFRRNGAATFFGTDLIRAAALRDDRWSPEILGFLNGFQPQVHEELLADPNPMVRELAAFFLGPFWREAVRARAEREAEIERLQAELDRVWAKVPPPGAARKLRWLAGLAAKRLRRSAG